MKIGRVLSQVNFQFDMVSPKVFDFKEKYHH